jgi:hypothetical protein
LYPQHDTAPLLDNAQECDCKTSRHIPTPPSLATMYPIRTTNNHKNGKSTQSIKPKTAAASNIFSRNKHHNRSFISSHQSL